MAGVFLLASPIFQLIFGFCGGYIAFMISEMTALKANDISTEIMAALSILGTVWFALAKSTKQKWASAFITLFSTCNAVLFFSLSGQKEYFYPDKYLIGSLISGILLIGIGLIKREQQLAKSTLTK